MAASRQDIRNWFDRGVKQGSTHLIVVCDTFDYDDYPVFVSKDENVREKALTFNGGNMQRVIEVYNLSMDRDIQMAEHRSFNY
jgi:hypothetical protein